MQTINEINTRIVVRNDTSEKWDAVAETAVLLKGEIGVEFGGDATKVKIGDGNTPWGELPYVTSGEASLGAAMTWGHLAGIVDEGDEATQTEHLGLVLPTYADTVDIAVLNANADLIDEKTLSIDNNLKILEDRLQALI